MAQKTKNTFNECFHLSNKGQTRCRESKDSEGNEYGRKKGGKEEREEKGKAVRETKMEERKGEKKKGKRKGRQ